LGILRFSADRRRGLIEEETTMSLKTLATTAAIALLLSAGNGFAAEAEAASKTSEVPAANAHAHAAHANPVKDALSTVIDTSGWYDAAGPVEPGHVETFNPIQPADWAKIPNPKTHSIVHMSATNPEHYAQYMTPEFAMQFADPAAWMNLANPASYSEFVKVVSDPETMKYWSQPGAYMHGLNPNGYVQIFNPASYMKLATAATTNMVSDKGWGKYNAFNPFNMMKQMTDSMTTAIKTTAGTAKDAS